MGTNLITFDGAHNVISSPGAYELSSRCPGLQKPVPWYRVVADVQSCGGNKVVGKIHIFFQNGVVTVTQSKGVWVSLGAEGGDVFPGLPFFLSRCPTAWLPSDLHADLCTFFMDLYLSLRVSPGPSPWPEFLHSSNSIALLVVLIKSLLNTECLGENEWTGSISGKPRDGVTTPAAPPGPQTPQLQCQEFAPLSFRLVPEVNVYF